MWKELTTMNSFDTLSNRIQSFLDFLSKLFSDGHSYSQVNTASSALSSIITVNKVHCGKHPDVERFIKRTFELQPSLPKYHMTWNVRKVFNYFRNLPVISDLTLKKFALKLAMLLFLASGGQRIKTMYLISLREIKYVEEQVFIPIMQKIKQSKPVNLIYLLSFKTYPKTTKLCVVTHLKRYIELTQDLRSSDKLFISYTKLHQAINKDIISRWCKTVMELNGIDFQKYSTHSIRSATSSKANSMGCYLKILSSVQNGSLGKHLLSIIKSKSRKS